MTEACSSDMKRIPAKSVSTLRMIVAMVANATITMHEIAAGSTEKQAVERY